MLLTAGTARYRDCDRRMIEQMLVSVALERQGELRRTQKLIDLLGRRDTVVGGTHTLTLLMGKP
jgi:hypothetical protein